MAPLQGQGILSDQGSWQTGPGTCTHAYPELSSACQGYSSVSLVSDTYSHEGDMAGCGQLAGSLELLWRALPLLTHLLAWLSTF